MTTQQQSHYARCQNTAYRIELFLLSHFLHLCKHVHCMEDACQADWKWEEGAFIIKHKSRVLSKHKELAEGPYTEPKSEEAWTVLSSL